MQAPSPRPPCGSLRVSQRQRTLNTEPSSDLFRRCSRAGYPRHLEGVNARSSDSSKSQRRRPVRTWTFSYASGRAAAGAARGVHDPPPLAARPAPGGCRGDRGVMRCGHCLGAARRSLTLTLGTGGHRVQVRPECPTRARQPDSRESGIHIGRESAKATTAALERGDQHAQPPGRTASPDGARSPPGRRRYRATRIWQPRDRPSAGHRPAEAAADASLSWGPAGHHLLFRKRWHRADDSGDRSRRAARYKGSLPRVSIQSPTTPTRCVDRFRSGIRQRVGASWNCPANNARLSLRSHCSEPRSARLPDPTPNDDSRRPARPVEMPGRRP